MFTPSMTEEELQATAYRDFLEIRMKVKIAYEQFIRQLKFSSGRHRAIHSLMEEKKVTTKSKNTWNVLFMNSGYNATGFFAGCCVYIPLYRGEEVDYLFINNMDDFVLEKISSHFLMRYKQRYIEYNGINLRGMHPAVYYMVHNQDNTLTYYMPKNWTMKDVEEKSFMISKHGLSLVKYNNHLMTFITFLDQENLSRYKAMIYEEESLWKELETLNDSNLPLEYKQALSMKFARDREHTKEVLMRYLRRICDMEKTTEEQLQDVMDKLDMIIDSTLVIEDLLKQQASERERFEIPDVKLYLEKYKKGK